MRGSIVDLFPAGAAAAASGSTSSATRSRRCGRSIPPTSARSGTAEPFTLMPASEALLDEDSVKRFRARYRETVRRDRDRRPALPGGQRRPAAGRDGALAAAVRGAAGDPVRPSRRATTSSSAMPAPTRRWAARREAIDDYFANRERAMVGEPGSYRPLPPSDAVSVEQGMDGGGSRTGRSTSPPPSPSPRATGSSTSRSTGARDFAPERARQRECLRSGRQSTPPSCGRTSRKSSSRATAPALASGLPGCSRTMASIG